MVQIKKILCPIDFSEFSRHAFDRAVSVARCYGAAISVLHVLAVPSTVPAIRFGPERPGIFGLHGDNDEVLAEIPRFLALEHRIGAPIETRSSKPS
jgi:nucleotide-binding universal stress UspA family protein